MTISEMRSTGFEPDLHKILELKGACRAQFWNARSLHRMALRAPAGIAGLKKAETEKLLEAYNLAAREGGQKIKKLFNLS